MNSRVKWKGGWARPEPTGSRAPPPRWGWAGEGGETYGGKARSRITWVAPKIRKEGSGGGERTVGNAGTQHPREAGDASVEFQTQRIEQGG